MAGGHRRAAGLRRLYADLLAARRAWPALRDFTDRSVRLTDGVILLTRGKGKAAVEIVFNITAARQPLPDGIPSEHEVLFTSELTRYCGNRREANWCATRALLNAWRLGPACGLARRMIQVANPQAGFNPGSKS